jgi:hypothetical protein
MQPYYEYCRTRPGRSVRQHGLARRALSAGATRRIHSRLKAAAGDPQQRIACNRLQRTTACNTRRVQHATACDGPPRDLARAWRRMFVCVVWFCVLGRLRRSQEVEKIAQSVSSCDNATHRTSRALARIRTHPHT